jgi:Flp pilus assembly secretin CpaC
MLKAAEIAQATSDKQRVINLLQLPGGSISQQVMLQVRFAEVNRRALQEAGISFFTSGIGFKNTWGRTRASTATSTSGPASSRTRLARSRSAISAVIASVICLPRAHPHTAHGGQPAFLIYKCVNRRA